MRNHHIKPPIHLDLTDQEYTSPKRVLNGAASIGSRPTYGDYEPNIEVFIFNFDENLYGENVSVSLVKFIRPELKFNSEKELILQMKADCNTIETLLHND